MDLEPADLAGLRAGDLGALERCYRAYGARIRRVCRNLLGNAHDADDACQDVFLRVHEHAATFRGTASFSTWIHRVAIHVCLHRMERERVRSAEPLEPGGGAAEDDSLVAVDEREAVEHLVARLDPLHRAVLLLREIEGLDYREIASVLGVPVGTVMSRLHRARQALIRHARVDGPLEHPRSSVV